MFSTDALTFLNTILATQTLFADDAVSNSLESLAGTLKAAKKRSLVDYGPELLLQGASDDVVITLKQDNAKDQ